MGLTMKKLTLPCCACSGEVTFVIPEKDDDRPTFLHTLPPCARFHATNTADAIIQYMKDCGDKKLRARTQ
jgi:hypothetical protein